MTVSEFINKVGFKVDKSSVNDVNSTITGIKSTAMKVLGAIGIGISLTQLNAIAEEFNQINDRINGIVDSSQDAKEVQKSILEAANNCKTSYAEMASNVEALKNSNSDVFPIEDATKFTEYVNKIGLVAGYSSGEISSMQSTLQRIVASGTADATTITTMIRSTPALAKQLADSFGVATDELSTMAEEGKLTAKTIKEAIFSSADAIDIAFGGLDYSVSDALLNIRNRWGFWVDDINSTLKITDTVAKLMVKGFNKVMNVLNFLKNGFVTLADKLGGTQNLLKVLAIAAGAFFAIMTWPTVIAHIKTFIGLLTSAGRLFKLSNFGVTLLITAIVFLFLIIDDFINFMQGNDSVIGYCFEKAGIDAEEMRQKIINIWNNLKTFFAGIWNSFKNIMAPVLDWIKQKIEDVFGDDFFAGLGTGMEAVINFLERLTDKLANSTQIQDSIAKIVLGFAGIVTAVKAGTAIFGGFKSAAGIVEKVTEAFKKGKGAAVGSKAGGGGGLADAISNFFKGFANMKTSSVLKAVVNIGIVVAALTTLAAGIMAISPYLAELTDASSLIETLVTITAVGIIGTALAKLASLVGNIPISQVVKGVANIAIAMGGFTVLAAAIMAISSVLADLSSPRQIAMLLATITAVGVIGSALAVLAGIVGLIPAALVVNGLADIALAIGGFTLIAEAYGALASIPGFTELMSTGMTALADLASGMGDFIGSLIGGIGEGISGSLPTIGENISLFAEKLQPFFEICGGADLSGVSAFLDAFSSFVLKMSANDLLSIFTGGLDLSSIADGLVEFAMKATPFFMVTALLPEEGFTNATALFESLSGMGNLLKSGGIVQGFTGEVDFDKIATGLASLADEGVTAFYSMVAELPEEVFTQATSLFESLSGMGDLLKSGGVAQWWSGEVDFDKITTGLAGLADDSITAFYTMVADLPEGVFTNATALFESLSGMGDLLKSGGITQWFGGEVDFDKITSGLSSMTDKSVKSFFNMVANMTDTSFANAKSLFNTLSALGDIGLKEIKTDKIDGVALSNFAQNVKSLFVTLGKIKSEAFPNVRAVFSTLSALGDIELKEIDTSAVNGGALSNFANSVKSFFNSLSDVDVTTVNEIIATLTAFTAAIATATSTANNSTASMRSNVVSVFSDINGTVITVTDSIQNKMLLAWTKAKENTENLFGQIGTAMQTKLKTAGTLVVSTCNQIKNQMINTFNGAAVSFNSIGANIMQGLVNGINSGSSNVVNAMRNSIKKAVAAAKTEAGIASPSKKFRDEVGKYFPEGMAVGIKDNTGVVTNAVSQMIGGLTNGGKDVFNTAINGMRAMASAGTVSMNTATTATGGSTDNSRSIYQNVEISNTFNGDKAGQQKSAKAMSKAAEDSTALLARGLAYAR